MGSSTPTGKPQLTPVDAAATVPEAWRSMPWRPSWTRVPSRADGMLGSVRHAIPPTRAHLDLRVPAAMPNISSVPPSIPSLSNFASAVLGAIREHQPPGAGRPNPAALLAVALAALGHHRRTWKSAPTAARASAPTPKVRGGRHCTPVPSRHREDARPDRRALREEPRRPACVPRRSGRR